MPHPKFNTVPHIFISYKHEDTPTIQAASKLIEQLKALYILPVQDADQQCGGTYWIDEYMTGGANWKQEIKQNLEWCDIFIILVTDAALNSWFITNEEIPVALDKRNISPSQIIYPIIVSTIDDKAIPDWLNNTNFRPSGTVKVNGSATKSRKKTLQDIMREGNEDDFWIPFVRNDLRQIIEGMSFVRPLEQSTVKTIDVMTSIKGGVGKTLFSLALTYAHMSNKGRKVIAIDANTSNVDLWSFLQKSGMNYPVVNFASESWQQSPIYGDRHSKVLKKEHHARLFNGCQDFWGQITEMIASERQATAAIIDTNLMVGNVSYIDNCIEAMRRIADAGIRVRLWFIWTFNALREKHFIERDIVDLEHAQSGVEIIHILNPSALIPEKINPEPAQIEHEQDATESDIHSLIEMAREIVERIQHKAPHKAVDPREYLDGLLKLEQDSNEIFEVAKVNQPAFASHVHVPLENLRKTTVDRMEFNDFYAQMEPLLELLGKIEFPLQGPEALDPIFNEWLKSSFLSGCPSNVVPCAYFNISLKGYTDYVTKRPTTLKALGDFFGLGFINMIQSALEQIEAEI